MSQQEHDADEAIRKLNRLLDDDQITIFTKGEATALKEVAKAWQSASGFVKVVRVMGKILAWMAATSLAGLALRTLWDKI